MHFPKQLTHINSFCLHQNTIREGLLLSPTPVNKETQQRKAK